MTLRILICLGIALGLSACSTTQDVSLAKAKPAKVISSVARSTGDSNANDMNKNVEDAFAANGISVKPVLPTGTRTATDVDAIVTYADRWHWDLIMYLKGLSISMFDADSGDLLITGQWSDSALHGFRDSREVTRALVTDMLNRLKGASQAPAPGGPKAQNSASDTAKPAPSLPTAAIPLNEAAQTSPGPAYPATPRPRSAASPAPVAAAPSTSTSAATPVGQSAFTVERLAKDNQSCTAPIASLTAKGAGFETYTVKCSTGDAISFRCELGNCRALQ